MAQEKRKRTRVPVHLDICVALPEKNVQITLINISLTGILCTASPLFRKDQTCRVVISLGEELKIAIDSKILRVDEHEAAIGFTSMDEESYGHLRRLVQYNRGDGDLIDRELRQKAFD
jgi:hypothetical protein